MLADSRLEPQRVDADVLPGRISPSGRHQRFPAECPVPCGDNVRRRTPGQHYFSRQSWCLLHQFYAHLRYNALLKLKYKFLTLLNAFLSIFDTFIANDGISRDVSSHQMTNHAFSRGRRYQVSIIEKIFRDRKTRNSIFHLDNERVDTKSMNISAKVSFM